MRHTSAYIRHYQNRLGAAKAHLILIEQTMMAVSPSQWGTMPSERSHLMQRVEELSLIVENIVNHRPSHGLDISAGMPSLVNTAGVHNKAR